MAYPASTAGALSVATSKRTHTTSERTASKKRDGKAARPVLFEHEAYRLRDDIDTGMIRPTAVEGHTAVATDGKVVVYGGTDRVKMSNEVWIFAERTKRWRRARAAGNAPLGRHSHCADIHQGKMYCYGGYGLGGVTCTGDLQERQKRELPGSPSPLWTSHEDSYRMIKCGILNSVSCLDLATLQWYDIPCTDAEYVKDHSSCVYRGRIYYFGGCVVDGRTNRVRVFDCKSLKFLPHAHFNPQLAPVVSLSNTMMHTQNAEEGGSPMTTQVPTVRSSHTATVWKGSMYIMGGRLSKITYCNEVFRYRFDTRHWHKIVALNDEEAPVGRCNHTAVVCAGSLIVFGGVTNKQAVREAHATGAFDAAGPEGKVYLGDCYSFHLKQHVWRRVTVESAPGAGPTPVGCHTTVLLKGSIDGGVVAMVLGGVSVRLDRNGLPKEEVNGGAVYMEVARVEGGELTSSSSCSSKGRVGGHASPLRIASSGGAVVPYEKHVIAAAGAPSPPKHEKPFKHYHCGALPPTPYQPSPPRAHEGGRSRPPSRGGAPSTGVRHVRPWAVGSAQLPSGEFGEAPGGLQRDVSAGVALNGKDVRKLVHRLTDEYEAVREVTKKHLEDVYLKPAVAEPERRPVEDSIRRLYDEAVAHKDEKKRALEKRYLTRGGGTKITSDEVDGMVTRLYRSPATSPTTRRSSSPAGSPVGSPTKSPSPPPHPSESPPPPAFLRDGDDTVQRLFYEGVRKAARTKQKLTRKYLKETEARSLSPTDQDNMLQRLYYDVK
eukprot:TRINITY_DN19626_c0_g1_i1.p1 TRINITY_DN19626_c0_g1~~TRINITY_DN19626_c0_g1_i1.p1  ORF type:complete len:803 (+),score=232.79 TRINITY_DN19626_c0_g1_i1:98-2410(+)